MDYNTLLDMATELGYYLAISGAETFRVEDSINRVLGAYGLESEVFAIPNCLTVSIETADGKPMTRMRRVGFHGNDLDSVERFNHLSRRICAQKPAPDVGLQWLKETADSRVRYNFAGYLIGSFLGAAGFGLLFGCDLPESLFAGLCGLLIGLVNRFMENLKVNEFFSSIFASFVMSCVAYGACSLGFIQYVDATVIGALMILVPGLLFTNALRDIIFGDTNSGTNRIVQVILIAVAIALGTGSALTLATNLWGAPMPSAPIAHNAVWTTLASLVGCVGFSILFNVHGPGGILCAIGGGLTWLTYCISLSISKDEILSYLIAAIFASVYAESMARIRKYPAISYLVVSMFPLLPGAGVYYATNCFVRGDIAGFTSKGSQTIAIAGALAVGILIVSTIVRLWGVWRQSRKVRKVCK